MRRINSKWVYAGLAFLMLMVMVYYSNLQSFWYDELYQLGIVGSKSTLADVYHAYAGLWDYTPPLYAMIAFVWVKLVPFTSRWLLLPSAVFVALGVYLFSVLAEKIGGRRMGVTAGVLAASSSTLILGAGHEFRAYALYFLCAVFAFYRFYLCYRQKDKRSVASSLYYGLSLTLLAYSHYYGALIIAALFLAEAFLFVKKKVKFSAVFPYVMAGILFLPWMVIVFLNHQNSMSKFWTERPSWQTVMQTIRYLGGYENGIYFLFLFSAVFVVLKLFAAGKKQKNETLSFFGMMLFVMSFVLGIMFLYARVINPAGGAFYDRYFIGIIPCMLLLVSYGVMEIYKRAGVKTLFSYSVVTVTFALFLFSMQYARVLRNAEQKREPYAQSVKVLKAKGDIEKPTTAILTTDCEYVKKGYEYLFEDIGKQVETDIFSQEDADFEAKLNRYDKLYILSGHNIKLTKEREALLERDFEKIYKSGGQRIAAYKRKNQ